MADEFYYFSGSSLKRLSECHNDLRKVMQRVIRRRDITIACGHRGEEEQNQAFDEGKSKLRYPESMHNKEPSLAVDVIPWPEQWDSEDAFVELHKIIMEEAEVLGVQLRWGGDWDGDWDGTGTRPKQSFDDPPHYELKD